MVSAAHSRHAHGSGQCQHALAHGSAQQHESFLPKHSEAHCRRLLSLLLAAVLCVTGHGTLTDYYEVLGVDKDASDAEIKRSHKQLALKWHPDKNKDSSEKTRKTFIRIQEAYEILSDPEKKKRYDNKRLFFLGESGEPWEGAEDLFNFEPPGDALQKVEEINEVLYHGEPIVIHVFADQRNYFGDWMNDLAKDIKMWHINVFTVDEAILQKMNVKRYPGLIVGDGFGRTQPYFPSGHTAHFPQYVRSFVAELVPYDDVIERMTTDDEVDNFLRLHPTGSSKPRVIFFTDEVEQQLLPFYLAAKQLAGTHHFAQLGAQQSVVQRFKLQRVPAFIVLDPATRHGATQRPQMLLDMRTPQLVEQLKEAPTRFLPELTDASFNERCQGQWEPPCRWIALFLVPSAALGTEDSARKALRGYRDACKKVGPPLPCFWLRHDSAAGGAAWREALRPLFMTEGVLSEPQSQGIWIVAVEKPGADEDDSPRAVAFPKSLVSKELPMAQGDLVKWLQSFDQNGLPSESSKARPAAVLEHVPLIPPTVDELTGPQGFVGKLIQRFNKLKLQQRSREIQKWCYDNGIGWLVLCALFLVYQRQSSQGAQAESHKYQVDSKCIIEGLKSNTNYNGQTAKIIKLMPPDEGSGTLKYKVRLKVKGEEKVLAILEDNLRPTKQN